MDRSTSLGILVSAFMLFCLVIPNGDAVASGELQACTETRVAQSAGMDDVGSPPLVSASSVCTADCWDGSTVACTGTTCSAQDSVCSAQRGYCESSDSPFRTYCPPCPRSCEAMANCANGGPVHCEGEQHCVSLQGCYAYCDGDFWWCFGQSPSTCPLP